MSKRLTASITAALGTAAFAIGAVPAMASPAHEVELGTPQCHGQLVAFFTQLGAEEGIHGIGNLTAGEITVKELQTFIRAICAPEEEPI